MGCSASKPRTPKRRRRRRRAPRQQMEPVPEVRIRVPAYQADTSEFEGESQTYRSELYRDEVDPLHDHKVQQGIKFKHMTYNGIHDVRVHHDDRAECRIRGAVFLPNGHLLLCDQSNIKLKLFNQHFKHLSHQRLPGCPHDLCVHSSDSEGCDIYVTIPSERSVLEFFVEDRLFVPVQTIRTDGWCYGIAPYNDGLVVGVSTKLLFMDTEGTVHRTLQNDENGDAIFESPFHISVTTDYMILVSDLLRKCLICISPEGDIQYRYRQLSVPHGLFVDSDDYIYLCGANVETVDVFHQLSKGGDKIKSLLSWRHVGFRPDTVCFREQDQLLAVCGENDRIKTYKLQTTRTGRLYSNDALIGESVSEISKDGRSTAEIQEEMKRILRS